jgi:HK97 family phage major capsid protein
VPVEYSAQILQEAVQQSAVLQLGNVIPMGYAVTEMPVPKAFPKAAWVAGPGGRKPYTDLKFGMETMKAEEIAAITAIPDVFVEDLTINIWDFVRPRLAEAIAIAIDDTILFGIDAPASFPVGGVAAIAQNVPPGLDAVDTVNGAMSFVETEGLPISGNAADIAVKGILRNVRASTGELLLGEGLSDLMQQTSVDTIFGYPTRYVPFTQPDPNFFTGDWRYLLIGMRQDIRYNMDPTAVVADDEGKVVISGWQDNTTPIKVWARFACAIVQPVTPRRPDGAIPFATTLLEPATTFAAPLGHAEAQSADAPVKPATARKARATS